MGQTMYNVHSNEENVENLLDQLKNRMMNKRPCSICEK